MQSIAAYVRTSPRAAGGSAGCTADGHSEDQLKKLHERVEVSFAGPAVFGGNPRIVVWHAGCYRKDGSPQIASIMGPNRSNLVGAPFLLQSSVLASRP